MNSLQYRIVFNAARGQLMAVAETATATTKTAGATRAIKRASGSLVGWAARLLMQGDNLTVRPHNGVDTNQAQWAKPTARHTPYGALTATACISPLRLSILLLCGATLISLPASAQNPAQNPAQIIADPNAPGNQKPTIYTTANGLTLVNIQTPSSAGVSRNTYSQFDVSSKGVILVNSYQNVQTQLGGYIQGNWTFLAHGPARIILNEVNSSNPSLLKGFVEVAGSRAEVIIANPSGINVNGGGFLNASRVVLTSGTAQMNDGSLTGFRIQQGLVTIEGAGLNTQDADYTMILTRAL